jgi:hypothetical protein
MVRQVRLDQAKEVSKLRQEFELQARELQQKYERKMRALREELDLQRKAEVRSWAGRWAAGCGCRLACAQRRMDLLLEPALYVPSTLGGSS